MHAEVQGSVVKEAEVQGSVVREAEVQGSVAREAEFRGYQGIERLHYKTGGYRCLPM